MSSTQQTTIPVPGYPQRRHRLSTRLRTFSVRPVMQAVGWILAGAGIGSLAVVAAVWALMRLTSIDDSSSTSSVGTNALHHVTREQRGTHVLAGEED
jgi:hypothetical protein